MTDKTTILVHQYENGLTLAAEPMEWLESAAFTLMVRGGCSRDPVGLAGLGNFTCEMIQRGCGDQTSREFVAALENLGVDRVASVSNVNSSYGGAMIANNLDPALEIYADLIRRPLMPAEQFEEGRLVCHQELLSLEDDLGHRVLMELARLSYPDPWGRSPQGTLESVSRITPEDVNAFFTQNYGPTSAVIGVAGKIDWDQLVAQVGDLYGDWAAVPQPTLEEKKPERNYVHIEHDSTQTHIGVSFPCVPYSHDDFFKIRGAVGILSDGMSSRLFTEVREKRGLCYTVFATCHSHKRKGNVFCYAGTSTERAQETYDVLLQELIRLREGVEQVELDRLKAKIKSGLIMQQESSPARSASIAGDWDHLGRVRSLDELNRIITDLTCDDINDYLERIPPEDFVTVTLGEKQLEVG